MRAEARANSTSVPSESGSFLKAFVPFESCRSAYTGEVKNLPGLRDRIVGSLLCGALGEAAAGPSHGTAFGAATQLTLYTADGLTEALEWANDGVAADEAACIWLAYLRWLGTQGESTPSSAPAPPPRWIDGQPALRHRRDPDRTTLGSLSSGEMGTRQRPLGSNDDGAGALQRSAPFGLLANVPESMLERLALDAAAITHGSSVAQNAAAVFAGLVHQLALKEHPLPRAVEAAAGHAASLGEESLSERLLGLSAGSPAAASPAVEVSGSSDDAAALLCRAVQLVMSFPDTDATAHVSGILDALGRLERPDVGVVGSVAGNLLGALHGSGAVPAGAVDRLEGTGVVIELADRLAAATGA